MVVICANGVRIRVDSPPGSAKIFSRNPKRMRASGRVCHENVAGWNGPGGGGAGWVFVGAADAEVGLARGVGADLGEFNGSNAADGVWAMDE
jgi:hypothetical protein